MSYERIFIMKHKHLTLEEREIIEDLLKKNFNLTEIGNAIGKHRTTISKEILNHRFVKEYIQYCSSFANCIKTEYCENAGSKLCKKTCKNFIERKCTILENPPYVCNGCSKKSHCRFSKYYYRAKDADNINFLEQKLELELEYLKMKYMKLIILLHH